MKRILAIVLSLVLIITFGAFALGSGSSSEDKGSSSSDNATGGDSAVKEESKNNLGDYNIEIKSSRLTTDFDGKPVIVITYSYTNNSDDATAFYLAVEDHAFQNGVGLNETFLIKNGDPYNSEDQMKEIKTGVTLDVEVAYDLNDTTTPVDVEVSPLISFDDVKITKTFEIAK